MKVAQSDESDDQTMENMNGKNGENENIILNPEKQSNLDSESDENADGRTLSENHSQKRAIIESDSENDSPVPPVSQNLQRNRLQVIDSDSESEPEIAQVGSVNQVKNSPLKESFILNSSQKKKEISSDDEFESNVTNNKQKKSAKHLLSSSEESGNERSPKKARPNDVSGLRL